MPQRIVFNFPITGAPDLAVLVDVVPKVDDAVLIQGASYRVCKVLHVVHSYAGVNRSREPIVYLAEEHLPTASEEGYAKKLSAL
jgi:hypothetical protein